MQRRDVWQLLVLAAVATTIAAPSMALAASPIGANLVLSTSIKKADGTSGQVLTTGSGVKTGHIQDGAITETKLADGAVNALKLGAGAVLNAALADGAVTDAKIGGVISGAKLGTHSHSGTDVTDATVTGAKLADGAVTDAKISGVISGAKLGSHNHSGADVTDATVTGAKLADGAVTDAKISGVISGAKLGSHGHTGTEITSGTVAAAFLPVGVTAGTVAAGDHTHAAQSTGFANVVIVEKGEDLGAKIAAITDASAANPYVVKVMPGAYGDITMKPFVDVEGSGVYTTTLGRVNGADNAEIRNLTARVILNSAIDASNPIVSVPSRMTDVNVFITANGSYYGFTGVTISRPATLTNVTVDVTSSSGLRGIALGNSSDAILNNVTIKAADMYAALDNSKNLIMNGGAVLFTGNEYNYDGSAAVLAEGTNSVTEIVNANLKAATTDGNHLIGGYYPTNATIFVSNSKMEGTNLTGGSWTIKCTNTYDNAYNARVCP